MTRPTTIVFAHGRGSRLGAATGGASKGLLALDDHTTILSNILDACGAVGLEPAIAARPDDPHLREAVGDWPTLRCEPSGYLRDLVRLTQQVGDVVAIDCDTVAEPGALRDALRFLVSSDAPAAFVVSALPLSDDPRAIRPVVREGRLAGLSDDRAVPRTAGIYRFRGGALKDLHRFARDTDGTFHAYMEDAAARRVPAALHVIPVAFNVNLASDLEAARAWWADAAGEGGALH